MPCDNYIVEWVRHCFNLATMPCDTACMQILTLFQSEDMHICLMYIHCIITMHVRVDWKVLFGQRKAVATIYMVAGRQIACTTYIV